VSAPREPPHARPQPGQRPGSAALSEPRARRGGAAGATPKLICAAAGVQTTVTGQPARRVTARTTAAPGHPGPGKNGKLAAKPVSGMPILDVDEAKSVIVLKRLLGQGYAGTDNELYTSRGQP
jgi:hypothetical protein